MSEQDDFQLLQLRVSRLERELSELRASLAATRRIAQAEPMFQTPAIAPVQPEIAPPPPPLPTLPPLVLTSLSTPPPPQISLENRLGSQIFNRIAIVALLIGTAYGLKLAIDNGLLGPVARVLIGLVAGAGLVLWSERFRRQGVLAFSYSLKAVGSGVLYLSLWAAFQLFHLLPSWAALAAMILVTAWNAFMAWSQDAELLAAYALLGGFLTPVLLSTGGNHEIFVFTYILTIDAATVALIRVKHWPRLLLGTFPATVLYFIGWYSNWYVASELALTAVFLVLFWVVFIAASLGHEEPSTAKSVPSPNHPSAARIGGLPRPRLVLCSARCPPSRLAGLADARVGGDLSRPDANYRSAEPSLRSISRWPSSSSPSPFRSRRVADGSP